MNLVEFPFATLSRRPMLGSIKCQRWISDPTGARHPQRWAVQGGSESGLPTEFDERVYVALMAVTKQRGFADRKVPFSVYQLLKIMGESTDSKHYRSVERSLERLLRASIVAEGAFWDAQKKELVHLVNGFHLIERYWLAYKEQEEAVIEAEGAQAYIVWGEELWRSFQSGYLKQLNLALFFSLQTPVARRLYRFLDKKLHRSPRFEIDIFQLSQQLGMAWYRYPAKVKEKLQPGIDELIA
jgi:plasmid replication initiation protein